MIEISASQIRLSRNLWEFNNKEVRVLGAQKASVLPWHSITNVVITDVPNLANHLEIRITNSNSISFGLLVSISDSDLPIFRELSEENQKVEQAMPPKSDRAGG